MLGDAISTQTYALPTELATAVEQSLDDWRQAGHVHTLWARDKSLWTNGDEHEWLGWLDVPDGQLADTARFQAIAQEVENAGFSHAMLLGMGGSSLGPEVMQMTFGTRPGFPDLLVLDSTDPAQVKRFEDRVDLANTLFIVSSKSGSTLEPNIFQQYFFERVKETLGDGEAGSRFIAITDPGSQLEKVAQDEGFRHIFYGWPTIGGRYSVLSDFGMIPSAIMGVDVSRFLEQSVHMVHSCAASVSPADNPGVVLGTILGVLARHGRDKISLITSPGIWDFGAWLEQLLAESTGKQGKGLIPVDQETLGAPEVYGHDRLFVYTRLTSQPDAAQDAAVDALEAAGHPVVRIAMTETYQLGQEMFRWEIATAVAGAIIGINPFDQPDVEESKVATQQLTSAYEETGVLPPETPVLEDQGIKLFTDAANAAALSQAAGGDQTLAGYLRAHLNRLEAGDYFCIAAYLDMNDTHHVSLRAVRQAVRDRKQVATCLAYGPRFLHSCGQAYKGGPNSGVFLQLTCDDAADLAVPGRSYTFSVVKAAQARGDFQVLAERKRRALRLHLGPDVVAGLATLQEVLSETLV